MSEARYTPPTVEQVQTLLDSHPLRSPSPLVAWGPLLALGVLLLVVLAVGGVAGVLLPWLGLGVLLAYLVWRMRRVRQVDQGVTRAQELAMLRHHEQALAMGWRLLPMTSTAPAAYLRTTTLIGHCLQELKAYEGAIACFDRLLEVLPKDHPSAIHLRIHRAMAALGCERLLDADDGLSRLRGTMRQYGRTPLSALYRFAELMQAVRTGHFADPLVEADTLLAELRPLGVEAGYGHALLALCYYHARPETETDEHGRARQREQAAMWWRRATTLLSPAALVARFPELASMHTEAGDV